MDKSYSFLRFIINKLEGRRICDKPIGTFWLVKVIYKFLFKILPDTIDFQGYKILLDPYDSILNLELLKYGTSYEQFEAKLFEEYIREGDVVLDIGAHVGYYTFIAAKKAGDFGKVYAFEPDPNNFTLLKKNVELNGFKNVVLINKAVSNQNEEITLYLSDNDRGSHSTYKRQDSKGHITVKAIMGDEFFKNNDTRVDVIKMDIEGAEPAAIAGMSHLITKNKNITLFTELYPSLLVSAGSNTEQYLSTLKKHGFRLYNIDEDMRRIELISDNSLLENYFEKCEYTNLLCLKRENPADKSSNS